MCNFIEAHNFKENILVIHNKNNIFHEWNSVEKKFRNCNENSRNLFVIPQPDLNLFS